MIITNGTIKYGRTVKTGDFENKRVDVELSFTIPEDEIDSPGAISLVGQLTQNQVGNMLGTDETKVSTPKAPRPAKAASKGVEKPAAKPALAETLAAPADEEDPLADRAPLPKAAEKPAEDDLGDMLGADATKEITDKELNDATQKCQAANKNAPAIRKALADLGVKSPPGRIIDLPQEKRQQYLDKLKEIKPLA